MVWKNIAQALEQQLAPDEYRMWVRGLDMPQWDGSTLTIYVPNQYYLDRLSEKVYPLLKDLLQQQAGPEARIEFSIRTRDFVPPPVPAAEPARLPAIAAPAVPAGQAALTAGLNERYTFEHFVVGDSNHYAYAAAIAVAQNPGDTQHRYNPLFIYGGTGLGKTHLMHAIGHHVLQQRPHLRVVYVNSEQFVNDVIVGIQQKKMDEVRLRYRTVDVLLMDDVQFFSGKDQTQEEFFHTFNTLHASHKQLVFTADKPVNDLVGFEQRVLSRFAWGLSADIQPPNLETRIAILKKRAEEMRAYVPDEITYFIAHNIKTHIRDLEGALNNVIAHAPFTRQDLTVALVKERLKDMVDDTPARIITIAEVQKAVADHFHLTVADLKSRKKSNSVSFPRQVGMFLARQLNDEVSLIEIGSEFGGRDHSTVLYAFNKISSELEKDQNLARIIAAIKERL